jgi:hypothetical protein
VLNPCLPGDPRIYAWPAVSEFIPWLMRRMKRIVPVADLRQHM